MSTDINDPIYLTLNSYAVLAASAITTVNTTTIEPGFSYGSSPTATYTGAFVGTQDSGNALTAQTELTALVGVITGLPIDYNIGTNFSGVVIYTPGVSYSGSFITYAPSTTIILDALGDPNAQFFIIADSAITFTSVSSISLINGASTCNIFWLAGAAISFDGTSPPDIFGIFIAGTAITFANASQISGRTYAQTAAISFSGRSSVNGLCTQNPEPPLPIILEDIFCYLKGTLILTKDGFVPIENIKTGHKVVTKGKIFKNKFINNNAALKFEPVYWASKFKVIDLNSKSRPICIKKDALGKNYPFQDLYVSPNHSLLLNGKMVLAKNLVNDNTIYQDKECDNVEYYHLECESHSAVIANGVLAESYFGGNNRDVFENSISLRRRVDFKKIYALRYI
jgi:hypothetical protein